MTHTDFNKQRFWFLLIIGFLLFKPAPGTLLGSSSVIGFTLLTLLFATLVLIIGNKQFLFNKPFQHLKTEMKTDIIFLYFFLVCISFIVSTIAGIVLAPDKTGITDFLELYRYACYIVFYLLAKNINTISLDKFIKPMYIMIIIIEVFGIFQFFNIININHWFGLLYTMSDRHFTMIVNQHRIPSTFLNPNMYGSFLIIITALLLAFLSFKQANKKQAGFLYFGLFLTIISVILTTSRTAVITLGGIIVYWFLLNLLFNRKSIKALLVKGISVLCMFVIIAAILIPQISYLNYAAEQIYNTYGQSQNGNDTSSNDFEEQQDPNSSFDNAKDSLESVSSFKNRYDYWKINYQEFLKSPVVGYGPMRSNFVSFADNSYLYILPRYGAIGLLVFIFFFLSTYWKTIRTIQQGSNIQSKVILGIAINLILVGYLVMGMVSEVWFNLQSIVFLFVLLGLFFNKKLKY